MASSLPSEHPSQRSSPAAAIEAPSSMPSTITPSASASTLISPNNHNHNHNHNHNTTPRRPRPHSLQSTPKSAPAQSRTHLQLTSPEAARRSKRSLEAIQVARTLKDGFLRLKARADPQHLLSPSRSTGRPLRTYSATMAPSRASHLLVRHHSSASAPAHFTSCPQSPRHLPVRNIQAPRFTLSAASPARDDHAWRPRLPTPLNVRAGAAEQAAQAMLFMRSQSSSSLNNDHMDSVSPPPSSIPQGLADPRLPLSSQCDFDASETEEEIMIPPIKRQRANHVSAADAADAADAASSTARHHIVQQQQPLPKQTTAFGHRRN
ncbi:hypothetical protein LPJ64_002453 [Coemansia asiatica]|uniref:Uncharacterized protein n=1 Tax=Coemansia asiatica TaxID=1052880 RepID=A0A9W7XLM3_9FUNG|nr:hypothetical protein LPJ64_002453 [Coemansia asiatica]